MPDWIVAAMMSFHTHSHPENLKARFYHSPFCRLEDMACTQSTEAGVKGSYPGAEAQGEKMGTQAEIWEWQGLLLVTQEPLVLVSC